MATETPIKSNFRKQFARDFIKSFDTISDDFYYLFYSRTHPWENDNEAPLTLDTFLSASDCWNSMIGLQLVKPDDLSLIVPRYNWIKNTVYSQYDDSVDLFNEACPVKFYVLNSDNRVYKCVSNNQGIASTHEPISTTTNLFQTPDGYKWKFLYQISEDNKKFLTSDFMPVETLTGISYTGEKALQYDVQQKAVDGSIEQVDIIQQGSHWPHTVVSTHFDGPNEFEIQQNVVVAAASVGATTVALNMKNILTYAGAVEDIVGYSLYIYSGSGAGQYLEITEATTQDPLCPDGQADCSLGYALLTLKTPLARPLSVSSNDISRFEILPTVKILGNGSGAVGIPKMEETSLNSAQYVVDDVLMVNAGKDYSVVRAIAVRPSGGSQSELTDNLQTLIKPQISPPGGHGADCETELGANDVMINVRTEGEAGGAITAVNDFRQFGIVKNPTINKGIFAGEIAGEEQDERIRLRVVKPNQIRIDFDLTTGAEGEPNIYTPGTKYDFVKGSEVTQEETGAKGIVLDWVPPVWPPVDPTEGAGWDLVGKLFLEVIGDIEFIKQSRTTTVDGVVVPGLAIYDSADNYPSYDAYNDVDIPFKLLDYTNETFDVGSMIIGTTSYSTAEIVDWVTDVGGQSGFIYLKDVRGEFIVPRIDSNTGEPLAGERITQFVKIDDSLGEFNISNLNTEGNKETNAGILGSDTSNLTIPLNAYKQSYVLNVKVPLENNVFVEGDFPRDGQVIFHRGAELPIDPDGEDDDYKKGTGYIVDSTISTDGSEASIEVTSVRDWDGEFFAGDTVTYIDNSVTGIIKTDITDPTGTKPLIEYPTLTPDSGEMLYIQNILPVMRNTERAEEMKLLLRF